MIDDIIKNANEVGVYKFLNISTNFNEFEDIINVSKKYKEIYYTLGIHPHEAGQTTEVVIDEIKKK